ncbi:MAG TPA: hypothetical protein VF618_00670 [Thermoanaerobaculia bacterium]
MSTVNENVDQNVDPVSVVTVEGPAVPAYSEEVRLILGELRNMRGLIPRLVAPLSPQETPRLNSAASVPPDFVELTIVANTEWDVLARVKSMSATEMRDLLSYALAYAPLADELEALAQIVRHSVIAARNKVGQEALTIYALAQRMAKRPENAGLAAHVADMRRKLGRTQSAEARERRAAKKAAAQQAQAVTQQAA